MATAYRIRDGGGNREWLIIEDDAGRRWQYDRTDEVANPDAPIHVKWEADVWFVRDADNRPLLRQDEDGLPERIVVAWDDTLNTRTAAGQAHGTHWMETVRLIFVRQQQPVG